MGEIRREMTLLEWAARLDENHLARRQYADLEARVKALEEALRNGRRKAMKSKAVQDSWERLGMDLADHSLSQGRVWIPMGNNCLGTYRGPEDALTAVILRARALRSKAKKETLK